MLSIQTLARHFRNKSHMVLKTVDITKKNNVHFDRENRGQLGNHGQGKSRLHYLSRFESLKGSKT